MEASGLMGVVAGESKICLCGEKEETLLYRGYSIEDLARYSSFEETAYLLLRGKLPTKEELAAYKRELKSLREVPHKLKELLSLLPKKGNGMDVLRTAISALGLYEPEEASPFKTADRLIASTPSMLLYWLKGELNSSEEGEAAYFLELLHGKAPTAEEAKALDISLILYAEHEFNASTFTVRTIASTLPDFYSPIVGGIGALKGPLHGGANERAMELIASFKDPDGAEKGILEMLKRKALVMGFGHRVYKTHDPRSPIIKELAKKLAKGNPLFAIAERIEEVMWREKKLFPNVDFYCSLVYHFLNIPISLFTPLFVMARLAGWSSHLIEQRENNKLIRPLSRYIGPEKREWDGRRS